MLGPLKQGDDARIGPTRRRSCGTTTEERPLKTRAPDRFASSVVRRVSSIPLPSAPAVAGEHDGHRSVIADLDVHHGAELAGGYPKATLTEQVGKTLH